MAGGGMQDHYGRPLDTLKDVFGISTATLRKEARALRPKAELVHAEPLDMIRLNDGTRLPAYGYHQGFKVADGQVLGRFRDGTAAIVANDHGKGRALIIGTLPGIAYLSGAFPRIPFGRGGEDLSGYIYPDYNQSVRQQVSRLFEPYLGEPPVRVSVPEVEATLHRHKETGAWSIALVNFTGRPIEELSLVLDPKFFEGTPNVRAQFGAAKRQVRDGRTLVTLPLDRFDYLYLE